MWLKFDERGANITLPVFLKEGNLDEAFEAAHALKGALGNLSLTPIYEKIVEITELLRNRTEMDYSGMLSDILRLRDELGELCK